MLVAISRSRTRPTGRSCSGPCGSFPSRMHGSRPRRFRSTPARPNTTPPIDRRRLTADARAGVPMTVVINASVVVKWLFDGPESEGHTALAVSMVRTPGAPYLADQASRFQAQAAGESGGCEMAPIIPPRHARHPARHHRRGCRSGPRPGLPASGHRRSGRAARRHGPRSRGRTACAPGA